MKVKTLTEIPSARGIIPAGRIIEIPSAVMEKLKGKVEPLQGSRAITSNEKTHLGINTTVIWQNPYPQGTPEARKELLRLIIEAMLYGITLVDDEQAQQISDMKRDVLSGKANLEDFRRLFGTLH